MTTHENKARTAIVNTMKGFRKVRTKDQMLSNIEWYDFASGVHNLELTTRIMHEEIHNIEFSI